jgi:predicted nucleotidyltransferase component of viral defense system
MKEYLAELIQANPDPTQSRNLIQEYLQARVLESLQGSGAMRPLAFRGGSALRFLYGIPRYSEDLDFVLERPIAGYNFRGYLKAIQRDLTAEGFHIEIKVNDQRALHSAYVSFYGLLNELNLPFQPNESISVKIEVDTNPPAGATLDTTIVHRHVPLQIQHHDRASLLAGKMHAILQRGIAKGRDLYDLMWYLSDPYWPEPNLTYLSNDLKQKNWQGPLPNPENWRGILSNRLQVLDWRTILSDVRPFLESRRETDNLTLENLNRLLYCSEKTGLLF